MQVTSFPKVNIHFYFFISRHCSALSVGCDFGNSVTLINRTDIDYENNYKVKTPPSQYFCRHFITTKYFSVIVIVIVVSAVPDLVTSSLVG